MKSTLINTQENNNLHQEEYISKILTMIETLYNNANTASYKPANKEKQTLVFKDYIQALKGRTARILRKEFPDLLKDKLWG